MQDLSHFYKKKAEFLQHYDCELQIFDEEDSDEEIGKEKLKEMEAIEKEGGMTGTNNPDSSAADHSDEATSGKVNQQNVVGGEESVVGGGNIVPHHHSSAGLGQQDGGQDDADG